MVRCEVDLLQDDVEVLVGCHVYLLRQHSNNEENVKSIKAIYR